MLNVSANGKYNYDTIYLNKTLDELVNLAHKENCLVNKWYYNPLHRGMFGYDNLVCSLSYACNLLNQNNVVTDVELATAIHDGWIENYTYWRDNKPYVNNTSYKAPNKPLGDIERNLSASLSYDKLSTSEQEKDIVFVHFLRNLMNNNTCCI